jgi:hypothetical protein
MGHMESSTDMGCAAATTAQQVTDTTGKKEEEEEEGAASIQQRPLWRRRADNPAYNRSKSANHVLVRASVLVQILQPIQTAARAFA